MMLKRVTGVLVLLCVMVFVSFQQEGRNHDRAVNNNNGNDSLSVEYLSSEATRKMKLPFSEAVRVGKMLYLSGRIGFDYKKGALVPGGIAAETKQALENMKRVLEQ
ncbi:MAG: hypothetical protein GY940_05800 [bacterium]|nr:hypothetical protein [bacterium]